MVDAKSTVREFRITHLIRAALLHDFADLVERGGVAALQALEVPAAEDDQAHRRRRAHGGGPQLLLQDADLAEEVAGTELCDLLAVALDVRGSLLDGEELV